MGKNLKGKELGLGISQREDGYYVGRYTNKYGRRVQKLFLKLQECRQWLADSEYRDEHSNIDFPEEMTVDSWFEYWISIKKRTVRPNTVRNYTERYNRNIKPVIGKKILGSVNTIHCQTIMNHMADKGIVLRRFMTMRRSMEYRHSTKEWRIGEPKSKAGYRTIPLTEEAVEILMLQKKKNNALKVTVIEWSGFVFLCRKGTPVKNSTYDTMLFKLCDKAKIPRFSMHVLRHTFATRCIEAGMKPKTLQTILGHSNIGITMNLYVHTIIEEQKQKEIDQIADALKVV